MAPRITLTVLAYNQSAYIEEAVRSALGQQCEPVEILLSDDASTDDTYARMSALAAAYQGPHTVILRRNERNLGIGGHYNSLVSAARGQLIVTMAGDDISTPDRVARIAAAWDQSARQLDLIASHLHDMTAEGNTAGTLRVDDLARWRSPADWVRQRPHVIGAAHAFTKRLFDRFGPLGDGVAYEDQIITFRALLSGGACTIDAPLVHYRRGGISARPSTAEARRARMALQNARHLAETEQLLRDAAAAQVLGVVGPALRHEQIKLRYFERLLSAASLAERLRTLAGAHDVPWGWRWRKFWSASAQ